MKCSYCKTETSNQNQVICEYCGSELSKNEPLRNISPGTKINQFFEDSGLRDLYKKIKKSLKE